MNMCIRIDHRHTSIVWQRISALRVGDELRTYYLAPLPFRALLVARNGLTIETVRGLTCDAAIGRDRADPGFAHEPGIEQMKITLFRVVDGRHTSTLSAMVRERAPQASTEAF